MRRMNRMSRTWPKPVHALLSLVLSALPGCGKDENGPSGPAPATQVVVTGDVVEVDDQTPVDGGATITLTVHGGATERLLFPSLYTAPPPSQVTIDLYDLVRRVEPGDTVRAEGQRTAAGIALESLAILRGRASPGSRLHSTQLGRR